MKQLHPSTSRVRNQAGFSLMEIMVAVGVTAVLTYAISNMLVNSGKQATSIASKSDFNSFVNELQGVFNNTGNCLTAIGGMEVPDPNPPPGPGPGPGPNPYPKDVTLTIGTTVYQKNATFGGATPTSKKVLKIAKFEFTGRTPASGISQFVVPLALVADRQLGPDAAVGGNLLSHTFNLIVTLDSANKIVACAGQYTEFWSSTGASGLDIIYTGGNVAIGGDDADPVKDVDPPQTKLDVSGTIQALSFLYRSDARLKENVRAIPSALDRVLQLHGVLYDWKSSKDVPKGKDQLGLVAQEVEKVFPEAVHTGSGNGLKSVSYGNLLAPMVEAFKEQQAIIERQDREIAELKRAISLRK